MAIAQSYKTNFETLNRAARNGDLTLVECTDKKTGEPVIALCAVYLYEGEYNIVPFARMFDGNPYDELNPPS